MVKIKLSKTYTLNKKEVSVINLDFDSMTGADFLDCEQEYKLHVKEGAAFKEFEDKYALTVASKASGIRFSDFKVLVGQDYMKVINQTKLFLNKGWGLEDEEKETKEVTAV